MALYVQYGCGLSAPMEWRNFDASPRLRFERMPVFGALAGLAGKRLFPRNVVYGDIVAGLPIASGCADAVYCSHVLEHLSRSDVPKALANTIQLLRSGGVFRMIVPDLGWRARRYVEARTNGEVDAADRFFESLNAHDTVRPRGTMSLLRAALGNSGHRWMFAEPMMRKLLGEAGFVNIRRCGIGDSGDSKFDSVEVSERFFDSGEPELAIQAFKP